MINLMVANISNQKRYSLEALTPILQAQIHNSLLLGWSPSDIVIAANFDFEFQGVKTIKIKLNKHCLTGSKMFAVKWLLFHDFADVVFAHDLDAWQNSEIESPPDFKDVGIACYSNDKFNGGVVFWRKSAIDIVDAVVDTLNKGEEKEEPTLNRLLKSDLYAQRVTVLNSTYNVGCSGFVPRHTRAEKPIKMVHLNPYNRIAWETHRLDRNGIGLISLSVHLEIILREHFPFLAIKLSAEGISRQKELRKKHEGKDKGKDKRKTKKGKHAKD